MINREYLIYSPSQGSLCYGPCKLFCPTSSQFIDSGFSNWKHSSQWVEEYENSHAHFDSVLTFKQRDTEMWTVDNQFKSQVEDEIKYWRAVLHRVVVVIKKLASRSLTFRWDDKVFGSTNKWQLYDVLRTNCRIWPFLKYHIDKLGILVFRTWIIMF